MKTLRLAGFAAIVAALLFPIWSVPFVPLLDWPNHLARAFVLAHLHAPEYDFARYFRSDWGPYPYVGSDLLLIALQSFMPVQIAGKILLSVAVLLLPVSVWWFLRQVAPQQSILALFACATAYDVFFLEGFVNLQLGIEVAFLLLGCWYRYRAAPSLTRGVVMFLCALLLYFTHLIAFGFAALFIFLDAAFGEEKMRALLRAVLVFLPGTALFLLTRPGLGGHGMNWRDFDDKLSSLYTVPLHGFSWRAGTLYELLLILALPLALWKNPEVRWNRRLPFIWIALLAIYFALPNGWGETWDIDVRILVFLFLLLPSIIRFGDVATRRLAVIAVLTVALRIADVGIAFHLESQTLQSLNAAANYIAPKSRVLPMVEASDDVDPIRRPYTHFWAYLIIERGVFAPYLFDIRGQTALRMTYDGYAPDGFWDVHYDEEPGWREIQENYDYVWAYGVDRFSAQLHAIASPVYSAGDFVLYRVNKPILGSAVRLAAPLRTR